MLRSHSFLHVLSYLTFHELINELELSYENIGEQLKNEKTTFISLQENKTYLIDVKNETETNYKQINDAASTLLEILKSKTDKI